MKYRLKLNKTQAYNLVSCHAEDVCVLPSMRKCDFTHQGRTYWLRFYDDCFFYKVTIQTCIGTTSIRFYNVDTRSEVMVKVDSSYLLENGFLEEVA